MASGYVLAIVYVSLVLGPVGFNFFSADPKVLARAAGDALPDQRLGSAG